MTQRDPTILDFERSLLATLMLRPGDCYRVQIDVEHFSSEQHADIYRVIREQAGASQAVDPVTICDQLEQQGRKVLGNLAMDIGNAAMVTAVPDAFAHRITGAWRQRQAKQIGMELIEAVDDGATDRAITALMALHATEQNHEWDAKQATRMAFQELSEIHKANGKLPGVTTGLIDLDEKLGGLHKGDMIVVGGRAAMGKTAFLLGLATAAARSGAPVGVISGEQPVEQMTMRMLSASARIDARKFRTAQFAEEEWPRVYNATADTAALPMWVLDRSAPTLAEVARVARRWKHKHGIKALYIDYLQRIKGEGQRKFEQVGFVAQGIKNLARDLDIPVVVLAQVSRAVETRSSQVPKMADLSDSSEIEKEADQVLMLFRPGYYSENEPQDVARVIVEKNRHGPTGYIDVHWNGATMTFGNLASQAWEEIA
jgi:replicative DNA helicase